MSVITALKINLKRMKQLTDTGKYGRPEDKYSTKTGYRKEAIQETDDHQKMIKCR